MGVFDRLFGKGGYAQMAQRAELRGDLARAAELWGLAGRPEETARVMVMRGDAELDPTARRQHYLQASSTAPEAHAVRDEARKKHALLTLALHGTHSGASGTPALLHGGALHGEARHREEERGAVMSAAARVEVLAAARELEELGEPLRAADGYRLAGDEEGQARALTQAGEIEKLETLLASEQDRDRRERARRQMAAEMEMLIAGGRRREALMAGQSWLESDPNDRMLRERCDALRARRTKGSIVSVVLEGKPMSLVFGNEVILGRAEGDILISSHAVSRRHLRIVREGFEVFVMDLGSRNGTHLRGMRAVGKLAVGSGLEIKLGNEVPLRIEPSDVVESAMAIEVAGRRYVAPLGQAKLPVGDWRLEMGDGWVELVSSNPPAFLGDAELALRATLLAGDRIASRRGGPCMLEITGES